VSRTDTVGSRHPIPAGRYGGQTGRLGPQVGANLELSCRPPRAGAAGQRGGISVTTPRHPSKQIKLAEAPGYLPTRPSLLRVEGPDQAGRWESKLSRRVAEAGINLRGLRRPTLGKRLRLSPGGWTRQETPEGQRPQKTVLRQAVRHARINARVSFMPES